MSLLTREEQTIEPPPRINEYTYANVQIKAGELEDAKQVRMGTMVTVAKR